MIAGLLVWTSLVLGAASMYSEAEHPPSWYDQHVEVIDAAPEGADTACLRRLTAAHIEYSLLDRVEGVESPVWITDETLGGVKYLPADPKRERLVLDCHTAEVLAATGRAIRFRAKVSTVHWSSSWRYSYLKGTTTLSQHAHGKALDIVAIEGDFGYATVRGHYTKDVAGCGEEHPDARSGALAALACVLTHDGGPGAFHTLYTPDTDDGHADHYHLQDPDPDVRHVLPPKKSSGQPRRWLWPAVGAGAPLLVGLVLALVLLLRRRRSVTG